MKGIGPEMTEIWILQEWREEERVPVPKDWAN